MVGAQLAFSVLAGLWAGQILGVSFIATPAKFLAPSLTLPVALDVGRATFRISLMAELMLGIALVGTGLLAFRLGPRTLAALAAVTILLVQWLLLLPVLDHRVSLVTAGIPLRPSWHHLAWIVGDAARFMLLIGLGVATLRHASS